MGSLVMKKKGGAAALDKQWNNIMMTIIHHPCWVDGNILCSERSGSRNLLTHIACRPNVTAPSSSSAAPVFIPTSIQPLLPSQNSFETLLHVCNIYLDCKAQQRRNRASDWGKDGDEGCNLEGEKEASERCVEWPGSWHGQSGLERTFPALAVLFSRNTGWIYIKQNLTLLRLNKISNSFSPSVLLLADTWWKKCVYLCCFTWLTARIKKY